MGFVELIISLVVFVGALLGAVLYLRADARAIRQEFRNDLSEFKSEFNGQLSEFRSEFNGRLTEFNAAISKLTADIEGLSQRVTVLESKVEALDTKIDTKAAELSAQMQRNHRELLIRLAFHHHGDGRYPVSAATDPEPVDPAGDNE